MSLTGRHPIVPCNKCGNMITRHRTVMKVCCGLFSRTRPHIDLCRPCSVALKQWLEAGVVLDVASECSSASINEAT